MPRRIRVAAAQIGAVHRNTLRIEVLDRMLALLGTAATNNVDLVLFPETAFTTFFPRYLINDEAELASFFEHADDITTSPHTARLFDVAREHGIDISIGYAESVPTTGKRYNTSVYYHAKSHSILAKYRKVHLPGQFEPFSDPNATNQLEKRYFKPGNLGFNAFRVPDLADNTEPILGMMICNDRRWPEAWRCLGLQGVELVLCGYNTAGFAPHLWGSDTEQSPEKAEEDAMFHHKLVMQSQSYMNATYSICAARCGMDDGKYNLIGGSCIVDPGGKILAESKTKEDELIFADIELSACEQGKTKTFDFGRHRRVEHYSRIVAQTGVVEPPKLQQPFPASAPSPQPTQDTHLTPLPYPKQINILLLNPNSTTSMTTSMLQSVHSTLPPNVHLFPFTNPHPSAPTAIESTVDSVLSATTTFHSLLPYLSHPSTPPIHAILIACYSAHPLIPMLREELDPEIPVMGIMEASLLHARILAPKFGIIATSQRSALNHPLAVSNYGMTNFCAGIESCDLGVLDFETSSEEELERILKHVARKLVDGGAEALCLGCAGMSRMREILRRVVGEKEEEGEEEGEGMKGVQIVDGVEAGVQILSGIVRSGGRTAKGGAWRSSGESRRKRGQEDFFGMREGRILY